jgi:hypothetical protein
MHLNAAGAGWLAVDALRERMTNIAQGNERKYMEPGAAARNAEKSLHCSDCLTSGTWNWSPIFFRVIARLRPLGSRMNKLIPAFHNYFERPDKRISFGNCELVTNQEQLASLWRNWQPFKVRVELLFAEPRSAIKVEESLDRHCRKKSYTCPTWYRAQAPRRQVRA